MRSRTASGSTAETRPAYVTSQRATMRRTPRNLLSGSDRAPSTAFDARRPADPPPGIEKERAPRRDRLLSEDERESVVGVARRRDSLYAQAVPPPLTRCRKHRDRVALYELVLVLDVVVVRVRPQQGDRRRS